MLILSHSCAASKVQEFFCGVAAGNIFDFLVDKDFYFIRHFYTLLFLRLIFYLCSLDIAIL